MATLMMNDGGRAAAGYRGHAGDCAVRSAAIATGRPYAEIYAAINALAKSERTGKRKRRVSNAREGVYPQTLHKLLVSMGCTWVPTMAIGQGCTVHLRADELPAGRMVVRVSKHYTAMIDGVVHDTHDPRRSGTRCVYGYWLVPSSKENRG